MAKARHFTPALFDFLRELKANNERAWFQANKGLYEEDVQHPALQLISDFGPRLKAISRHFVADPRPSGGSLFRIYRDTRFARDKSPYKTHVGIQFRHEAAASAHTPGFYLHLEPGRVFVGLGIWHPQPAELARIREALVADPKTWQRTLAAEPFQARFELSGESLARPPRGFPVDHPLAKDLKRKDFIAVAELGEDVATAPGFLDLFGDLCRDGAPLVRYLCRAIEVPF